VRGANGSTVGVSRLWKARVLPTTNEWESGRDGSRCGEFSHRWPIHKRRFDCANSGALGNMDILQPWPQRGGGHHLRARTLPAPSDKPPDPTTKTARTPCPFQTTERLNAFAGPRPRAMTHRAPASPYPPIACELNAPSDTISYLTKRSPQRRPTPEDGLLACPKKRWKQSGTLRLLSIQPRARTPPMS
jgi:hypothetical protein